MNHKSSKPNVQFFWDSKQHKKNKNRFNLLLLEYGEYFLEDLSAYYFPIPTNDITKNFEINDSLKLQGRLKLSTRSVIFEPIDVRRPIIKFPYKNMLSPLQHFHLKESEIKKLSVEVSGFFTFLCASYFEMKPNNKVGPYKLVEYPTNSVETLKGFRILLSLVHSDLNTFMVKVEQFRHINEVSDKQGTGIGNQLLRPFIETALISHFDNSYLVDFHEKLLLQTPISVKKVKPLIINPGSLMVTDCRIYFQPSLLNNIGDSVQHIELRKISRVFKRRYMLRQTGLELILQDPTSPFLFAFDTKMTRDIIYELIFSQLNSDSQLFSLDEITRRWQRKELSNFQYLMYLNNEADRTSNDLTQYPVFPHIIADFTSKRLDLDNPNTFRELSKPIGAINIERLKYFKERFYSMSESEHPPPFLYGTHYSTPGYVLYYLVRVAPEYMLCLQNGKFDAADRMFHSIAANWESCLNNPADLKELIPEFFCGSGEFLINFYDLELGFRHTGGKLNDVELPNWADSPRDFIRKNAKALESDYVSEHLHEWIDLIFGYKQKGKAAIEADNLFYYLTYEGSVDLEQIIDERERAAIEVQIQEFGQTPKQLFTNPHPRRNDFNSTTNIFKTKSKKQLQPSEEPQVIQNDRKLEQLVNPSKTPSSHSSGSYVMVKSVESPEMNSAVKTPQRSAPVPNIPNNILEHSMTESTPITDISNKRGSNKSIQAMDNENALDDEHIDIEVLHIDEEFRAEVEKELEQMNQSKSDFSDKSTAPHPLTRKVSSTSTPNSNSFMSSFGAWTEKTVNLFDRAFGSSSTQNTSATNNNFGNNSAASVKYNNPYQPRSLNGTSLSTSSYNSKDLNNNTTSAYEPKTRANEHEYTGSTVFSGTLHDSSSMKDISITNYQRIDPHTLTMCPSAQFQWHKNSVTGVFIRLIEMHGNHFDMMESSSSQRKQRSGKLDNTSARAVNASSLLGLQTLNGNQNKYVAMVASVSKDSYLKITKIEYKSGGSIADTVRTLSSSNYGTEGTFTAEMQRKYSGSYSPLTGCVLCNDGDHVFVSSLDKNVYGYSIINHIDDQKQAHEEGVTCIALNENVNCIITGSLDSSVKVWQMKNSNTGSTANSKLSTNPFSINNTVSVPGNHTAFRPASTASSMAMIGMIPMAEFCDHDNAICCVAMDAAGTYIAAGSEDGILIVWHFQSQSMIFSYAVTRSTESITSIKWMPYAVSVKQNSLQHGFSEDKIVCSSSDGHLVCLDSAARLFSDLKDFPVGIQCIDIDNLGIIYGGCMDGSVHAWMINSVDANMIELFRYLNAHVGPVNSLSIGGADFENIEHSLSRLDNQDTPALLIVTGGEDSVVRVWKTFFGK